MHNNFICCCCCCCYRFCCQLNNNNNDKRNKLCFISISHTQTMALYNISVHLLFVYLFVGFFINSLFILNYFLCVFAVIVVVFLFMRLRHYFIITSFTLSLKIRDLDLMCVRAVIYACFSTAQSFIHSLTGSVAHQLLLRLVT